MGTISWNSREWVVHRAMWTVRVGPIPADDDWTLDHLCSNRACVNVDHLEVVTRTENSRRGGVLLVARAQAVMATECKRGHPCIPANTHRTKDGHRHCLACRRDDWAEKAEAVNAKRREAYAKYRAAGMDGARRVRSPRRSSPDAPSCPNRSDCPDHKRTTTSRAYGGRKRK